MIKIKILLFRREGQEYGIPVADVEGVMRHSPSGPGPDGEENGIAGSLIPVLENLAGLQHVSGIHAIIVRDNGVLRELLADELVGITETAEFVAETGTVLMSRNSGT